MRCFILVCDTELCYACVCEKPQASAIKTTSPWKGIQTLMAIFSRFLHPSKMALLAKYYNDLQVSTSILISSLILHTITLFALIFSFFPNDDLCKFFIFYFYFYHRIKRLRLNNL